MTSPIPHISIILGSTRQGRHGDKVAAWFLQLARAREDATFELLDLRDYPMPFFDEPSPPAAGHIAPLAQPWVDAIGRADGFVIVTPEYNFSFPGVLKNAIDHAFFQWSRKAVAYVGYGGPSGGIRSVVALRQTMSPFSVASIGPAVHITNVAAAFDEAGQPVDALHDKTANRVLNELVWWASALKSARAA